MAFIENDPLRVEYIDGRTWLLVEDFVYLDVVEGELDEAGPRTRVNRITVPAGFSTDFASIPRFFWRVLPPTGEYGKAAVIHDFLYTFGADNHGPVSKAYADGVFLRAMEDLGVGAVRRQLMYRAVRLFGRGNFHA